MRQMAAPADVIIEPTKQQLHVIEAADHFILLLDKICYRNKIVFLC
jgi:glutamate-1-semialdehyde aminotransferase